MKKIIAIMLAVFMLAGLIGCAKKTGSSDKDKNAKDETTVLEVNADHALVAIESDNYKVTNGMLSYFYLYGFYNVYSNYSSYFQSMGFDVSKPLNEQQYGEDMTWHDYFLDMTLGDARTFVRVAEAAKADGYDDSYVGAEVQKEIDKITNSEGLSINEYIAKMFGSALDESDLRAALALQIYVYDYYEDLQSNIDKALTTEDCETYYNENHKAFSKVDYISYTVTASTANTEDTEAAYAAANVKALELAAETEANGVEGFKSWVSAYMTEQNAVSTTPMAEDALANQIAKTLAGVADATYAEDNEISEFCFEEGRKAGDCKVTDNGAGSYTVTVVSAPAHRVEDITKNVRHILFNPENYEGSEAAAKEKAEEVLEEWKNGEATVESYDALAKEYNDDSSSLYENVYQGEMVETFDAWLFDPARVPGDTGIVETDFGYHVMYFVGDGYPGWESEVRTNLIAEKLSVAMTEFETTYEISEIKESIDKLPYTIPETAFENASTNIY